WIEAVKNHRTTDGATVIEVLQYAEVLRPEQFKIGEFDIIYDQAGEPVGVDIGYFIGLKRGKDDEFIDLAYNIAKYGGTIELVIRDHPASAPTTAIEGGRRSFITYVDQVYKDTCIDRKSGAKLCWRLDFPPILRLTHPGLPLRSALRV